MASQRAWDLFIDTLANRTSPLKRCFQNIWWCRFWQREKHKEVFRQWPFFRYSQYQGMCSQVCELFFKATNTSFYSVLACSLEKTQDENISSSFNFCLQSWRALQGTEMNSKVWFNTAFGHSCFSSVSSNLQGIILPPNQSPFAFLLVSLLTFNTQLRMTPIPGRSILLPNSIILVAAKTFFDSKLIYAFSPFKYVGFPALTK